MSIKTSDFQTAKAVPIARYGSPTYTNVQHAINLVASAGMTSGGAVTDAGTETVNVAAGTGWIKATDSDVAEILSFDWAAVNGIAIPTNTIRYIMVEYGTPPTAKVTTLESDWDLDTSFPLAKIVNEGGTLHILCNPWWTGDGTTNIIERLNAEGIIVRDKHVGGLAISVPGTRNLAVTTGTLWSRLNEFVIPALDTSVTGTFEIYWRSGASAWTDAAVSQYPITQWNRLSDNSLQTISNNWYFNWWVYAEADDTEISLVYPQAQYASSAGAEAATPPSALPVHISESAILIGRIICKQGQDAPVQVQSAFTQQFTASQAADHGNLAGLADDDHTQYARVSQVTSPQTIGLTGSRLTKLWTDDITATNAIAGSVTGNAGTVTGLTLNSELLTLNTGALTLTPNADDSSVLTIGAGAVGVSGTNTGDNTVCTSGTATTAATLATPRTIGGTSFNGGADIAIGALTSTNVGATTSLEFKGVISDETGSGALVFGTSPTIATPKIAMIHDVNGNETLGLQASATAINYVNIINSATGNAVQVAGVGDDDNVGLTVAVKGTGPLKLYAGTGGTTGHTVPAVADDTVALLAAAQEFTNKTVTTPTMSLANAVPTADGGIGFDRTNEDLAIGDGAAGQLIHMGAWKAWTPSIVNITLGSGTAVYRYHLVGKMCTYFISILLAADSSIGTSPYIPLPFNAAYDNQPQSCTYYDNNVATYYHGLSPIAAHRVYLYTLVASGTYLTSTVVNATVPFTWATNDFIRITGTYEAA